LVAQCPEPGKTLAAQANTFVKFNNWEIIMGYFSELHYDIQEMYIDGLEPDEIASKLKISVGKIVSVLNELGVRYDQQDPA
jgi:hypothetical protein